MKLVHHSLSPLLLAALVSTGGLACTANGGDDADTDVADIDDGDDAEVGAAAQAIAADGPTSVWGVSTDFTVWGYAGHNGWAQEPGPLRQVAVGGSTVWALDMNNKVRQWDNASWVLKTGTLSSISVGVDDAVWGVGTNSIVYRRNNNGSWTNTQATMTGIAVGNAAQVWTVDASHNVYKWSGASFTLVPGIQLMNISASGADVWGVTPQGGVVRRSGDSWVPVAAPVAMVQLSVASPVEVWAVTAAGGIYRWLAEFGAWEHLSGALHSIAAGPRPPAGYVASFNRGLAAGAAESAPKPPVSYSRGLGVPLNQCDDGWELDGALCYPECSSGYDGQGPMCWQSCPAGYTNMEFYCQADTMSFDCPWYDMCGVFTDCGGCPSGWTNMGCSCQHGETFWKDSYGRGAGVIPHCHDDQEQQDALCYTECQPGYEGFMTACSLGGVDAFACQALYDPTLAKVAKDDGSSMLYGLGFTATAGVSGTAEVGVVYGPEGEFGCYYMGCAGVGSNISFADYGAVTVLDVPFDEVAEVAYMTGITVGEGVAVQTAAVFDSHNNYIGQMNAVLLTAGLIPVEASAVVCTTTVTQP